MPHAHFIATDIVSAAVTVICSSMFFIIIVITAKALSLPFSGEIFHSHLAALILTIPGAMISPTHKIGEGTIFISVSEASMIGSTRRPIAVAPGCRIARHPHAHFSATDVVSAAVTVICTAVLVVIRAVAAKALTLPFSSKVHVSHVGTSRLAYLGGVAAVDFVCHSAVVVAILEAAEEGRACHAVLKVTVRGVDGDDVRFEVAAE